MPMSDLEAVYFFQGKIDDIVAGFPLLFNRLMLVVNNHIIWNLLRRGEPRLRSLELMMGPCYKRDNPPIDDECISRDCVKSKRNELKSLEAEVVELFKRCETVIPHMTLHHLCMATGQIFVGPLEKIGLYEIYYSYLEEDLWKPLESSSEENSTD